MSSGKEFPTFNNPFVRESLRPLIPTAQQLRDKRYKPTVEAIYLKRNDDPDVEPPLLPYEGKVQVPVILGRPGDPNRHLPRPRKEDKKEDEYVDFRNYGTAFIDLQLRIQQIRERSAMYPIWAGDTPSVPNQISRKFNELNQQLFSLKKCFVSPEEIMLDNTATVIQRFWRAMFQRRLYRKALDSIKAYKLRELGGAHRTLNSWMAQMEYADSRAQQLNFRSIARVSRVALRYWQKWSEREAVVTNRNEARATEQWNKIHSRRNSQIVQTWRDIAMGPRSRKALHAWRQSMIPVMKRDLEVQKIPVPQNYIELVAAYVAMRAKRSFMFNFFLAWHAKYHSKSLRQTVIERNAFIFHKKKLQSWSLKHWLTRVRKTKAYLKTPEKWERYIALARAQHSARMSAVSKIVEKWHDYARIKGILKKRSIFARTKLMIRGFKGWRDTVVRHRELKMKSIMIWKRTIQDPKVFVFRSWNLYAVKKKTRRAIRNQLAESNKQWTNRMLLERMFGKWQRKAAERHSFAAAHELEKRRWELQSTKQRTTLLSGFYAKEREKIASIEANLGDVTQQFVASEEELAKLEEVSTTWKIALHAMKMELMRLSIVVQKCSTPKPTKQRRYSDEDYHDRLKNDDRYGQDTRSKLSMMKVGDRVVGRWERRNSDPDFDDELNMVEVNPPLDENIVQLLSIEK
ncbi:hypothetical protein TRFO_23462 [Tritrichomonas foetus]|uniref:IQ calmodulin-binding motif family protein n=1 Tax=Tritrichomonas foetus TaxID=1144522 RepID=A0A1J4KAW9_9EUKA|nr:hypothetical protein TRFO_23462 [Tritrichomonas foetus]|eukprot:OHT08106.1 hypothetical protein TRFO_23462 [Tritrichomonas foetus]